MEGGFKHTLIVDDGQGEDSEEPCCEADIGDGVDGIVELRREV